MTARAGIFIWIIVLGIFGTHGYLRQSFNVRGPFLCLMDKVRSDEPAPNILFIGSSRLGSSVDAGYLQGKMAAYLDDPDFTIERLAIPTSWPTQYSAVAHEYVTTRGAPDIVIMLPSYAIKSKGIFQGTPLFSPSTALMADLNVLSDVQARFLKNDPKPHWIRLSQREWSSTPERWLFRATNYILTGFKDPVDVAVGERTRCRSKNAESFASPKIWHHNTVTDTTDPFSNPKLVLMPPEDVELAENASGTHLAFDPRDPIRRFETAEIRDVVDIFLAEGSRVYFTIIPTYGRNEVFPDTLAGLTEVFPDVPFIDSYPAFSELTDAQQRLAFRDSKHMNIIGGTYVSRFWAEILEDIVK